MNKSCRNELTTIHGAFLMPSCCNPTTIMISDRRKRELADVIKRHQIILIEDDIHAFFTAGIVPDYQGALSSLVPEQSIYLCGTSKPLCSGLRVAYLVYPDRFREEIQKAIFNVNVKTSSLDAEIISELILSGKAFEILRRKCLLAEEMNSLFFDFFPDRKDAGHPLSFFRWLPITDQRSGTQIEQELQDAGIRVYHSDRFLTGSRRKQTYLRIALSTVSSKEQLQKGLSILADLL